jgi:hypothetical protein
MCQNPTKVTRTNGKNIPETWKQLQLQLQLQLQQQLQLQLQLQLHLLFKNIFEKFSFLSLQNPNGHLDGGVEKADGHEAAVPAGGQAGDALVQLEGPPVHQAQHLRPALRLRAGGDQLKVPEFGRLVRAARHNASPKSNT